MLFIESVLDPSIIKFHQYLAWKFGDNRRPT